MRSNFVAGKLSEILLVNLMTIFLEVSQRENLTKIKLNLSMYISINEFFESHTPSRSYVDLKKRQNLAKMDQKSLSL